MADETEEATSNNPYLALRAAKIARNQARLKELGLYKPAPASSSARSARTSKKAGASTRRKKTPESTEASSTTVPRRRSLRISGLSSNPDYVESKDFGERGMLSLPAGTRQRGGKRSLDTDPGEPTHDRTPPNTAVASTKPAASSRKQAHAHAAAPAAANSVRTISLDISTLVRTFLAKPMETFGKYFVIESSFHAAAYPEDQERLEGVSRLSFNKFSGVQPWKNAIFLWINVGGPTDANSLVNDFTDNGSRVTWFGGSKMTEDSPVIQTLIRMGKEAASNPEDLSTGIVLWCRQYNWETKKLLPYTCFGRLAYESHIPGSYPVAFTWILMDHKSMIGNEETKKVFDEISGSE